MNDNNEQRTPIRPGIGRRDFLKGTAIAGAALPSVPIIWTASSKQAKANSDQIGSNMKTRKLGTLEVSELGAGAMSISANCGPPADISEGIKTLRAAHENGVTFFDTAEVYGPYTSEGRCYVVCGLTLRG